MLGQLPERAPDKILHIMRLFAEDTRPGKIDLGVGVFRDAAGRTPVMAAVKTAEARLLERQQTKGYVALAGDPEFHAAMRGLVLGAAVAADRVAALATPGGTGAVRQCFEAARLANPDVRVLLPEPSWPNHASILDTMGIAWASYRYYDAATGGLDRAGMLEDLARTGAGDLVLLHGCCHNPTGADPQPADWAEIAMVLGQTGAVPMVDMAYQGFGDGLEADAAGPRLLAETLPEMLLAVSGSKNFGLYRERVGMALAVCATPAEATRAQALLAWLNRQAYAFPPDHGARLVTDILTDPDLRTSWTTELSAMRELMNGNRRALAQALQAESGSDRFGFIAGQRGMFSLIGADPAQVAAMRDEDALYMIGDGRINLAGLTPETIPRAARIIARHLR